MHGLAFPVILIAWNLERRSESSYPACIPKIIEKYARGEKLWKMTSFPHQNHVKRENLAQTCRIELIFGGMRGLDVGNAPTKFGSVPIDKNLRPLAQLFLRKLFFEFLWYLCIFLHMDTYQAVWKSGPDQANREANVRTWHQQSALFIEADS